MEWKLAEDPQTKDNDAQQGIVLEWDVMWGYDRNQL